MKRGEPINAQDLFAAGAPKVYTMPAGVDFLSHFAAVLRAALGDDLPSVMILLPTRRAVRELADAFLAASDGSACLLPLMRPLADMDENEPPFAPGDLDAKITQSISAAQQNFELAHLVNAKLASQGRAVDAAGALAMSAPLASLLADMDMEELGPQALGALDMKTLPAHFQDAAIFVKIVAQYWPTRLAELGLMAPMQRRVALLGAASEAWTARPPSRPVIVAGSTGSLAATARLIKTIAGLPKGLVVLPGLDTHADEESFKAIDEQHPQSSLKSLIKTLGLARADIPDWPGTHMPHMARMRARVLSESLISASATSDWPARIARINSTVSSSEGGDAMADALSGLCLIEAKTDEEEAGVIALIMRETLEPDDAYPRGRTCALVTPDPSLARRVSAKLSRWNITVDSSAGAPLEETAHGSFAALSLALARAPLSPLDLTALVKHALFGGADFQNWGDFETIALRGVRPKTMDDVRLRLKKAKRSLEDYAALQGLHMLLDPLREYLHGEHRVADMARAHVSVIESLAGGAQKIWSGEAGEKLAALMGELIEFGDILPAANFEDYQRLISSMMRGRVVRPRFGTETRLQILGPLEARMLSADTVILGSLNEGVWPAPPSVHPMLSRGMRFQIGLSAPERRFGLAAHDFEGLAAKPNVVLTRARRSADGPNVLSRWLWRLTTLARGAEIARREKTGEQAKDLTANEIGLASEIPWLDWARALDVAPDKPAPAPRPEPRPAPEKRWPKSAGGRKLSVTQVSTFIRDPYSVYAKHVLGIRPLDGLGQAVGAREMGTAMHDAFERYANEPKKGAAHLLSLLKDEMRAAGFEDHSFARHDIRLKEVADWTADYLKSRNDQGWNLAIAEDKGRVEFTDINFALTGKADRIEKSGSAFAVLDYKTGGSATNKEISAGFDPQLALLAYMLEAGGFEKAQGTALDLLYIKPRQRSLGKRVQSICLKKPASEHVIDAVEDLKKMIAYFDLETTAYYSQPRAKFVNPFGDYDQMARRSEWAALGSDTGEGGGA